MSLVEYYHSTNKNEDIATNYMNIQDKQIKEDTKYVETEETLNKLKIFKQIFKNIKIINNKYYNASLLLNELKNISITDNNSYCLLRNSKVLLYPGELRYDREPSYQFKEKYDKMMITHILKNNKNNVPTLYCGEESGCSVRVDSSLNICDKFYCVNCIKNINL